MTLITKFITTFYSIESVTAHYKKYINSQLPITNSDFDTKKINHKQQRKIKYMLIDNKKKLHNQLKLINISDK
mgnify:FL=1